MLVSAIPFYYSHSIAFDIIFAVAVIAALAWLYRADLLDLWQSKIVKTHNQ